MASDPDSCIPGPLKDFVFDLHDCVCTSQIHSEQVTLYSGTFRELTSKYFAQGPWPSPQSIASECSNDTLFLALYKELTHRHLHSVSRPQVQDRIDGWHVYRNLFDLILASSEDASRKPFYLLPEWCFDILHEFVYQFQGFCQFRTSNYANACKHKEKSNASKELPNHLKDALDVLGQNRDAWAVETVLFYLHRLVNVGSNNKSLGFRYLAHFATVTLARLECLLGDYHASLEALTPLLEVSNETILTIESLEEDGSSKKFTTLELVQSVFAARLSMSYHSAVSYLMLRRYKDAARVLSEQCVYMQRSLFSGAYLRQQNSHNRKSKDSSNNFMEQYQKLFDRMVALLAILVHACPYTVPTVTDSILRVVREKHGKQWNKIEAGEEGYEDLFIFACPKFICPAVPDYAQAQQSTGGTVASPQDSYKLQVKHFMNEMAAQPSFRKLRSYMKLYTSISVSKLAAFNDVPQEDEFLPLLLSYKHKMRQLEQTIEGSPKLLDGTLGTALDIHYYIHNDMVHVDEAEKQRGFENYFLAQIHQNEEVRKDVEGISIKI
eukprot:CAMPEP_0197824192 /NCGR_PEP_ID=MMETSP1437-20131217/1487_1 /TAXON_ID=49252 ORGANISM="Eucampia antarctica, Strain CCMP1452" /NCGR_SAMPLE_ID=MMETSP1437 /ASSEMBLY_ACC=CAM_ASM_001096 /LENGTH=550 /DNA_ID=CAMNT_0043423735 /DNA_START=74 /DNA_END=1726 /DNA_ORIENTATION=+